MTHRLTHVCLRIGAVLVPSPRISPDPGNTQGGFLASPPSGDPQSSQLHNKGMSGRWPLSGGLGSWLPFSWWDSIRNALFGGQPVSIYLGWFWQALEQWESGHSSVEAEALYSDLVNTTMAVNCGIIAQSKLNVFKCILWKLLCDSFKTFRHQSEKIKKTSQKILK